MTSAVQRPSFFLTRVSRSPVSRALTAIKRKWSIEAIALVLYFIRDAYAGAVRYYLNLSRLDALWFIPDLVAFVCLAAFIRRYVLTGRSVLATMFILYLGLSVILGYIFLGTFSGIASAFKMFAPVFVGFCFCERRMEDYTGVLAVTRVLFYTAVAGVVVSAYIKFPWVGFTYESFGATREAGRLWWSQSEVRLAGLSADSTMAAFFIMINFVFCAVRSRLWWILLWGGIGLYAIKLTTNKTNLGVMALFIVAVVIVRLSPENARFRLVRMFGVYSFLAISIPVIMIVLLTGLDLNDISPVLFSMQDRINNSWQKPFIYMADLMPIGYLTGCGLGCFNYPQELFAPSLAKYFVPVDNFYIGTLLMFGLPFVVFMIYVINSMRYSTDIYKLTVIFVMNIFTITILSYGPASGLLMLAFCFSDVFVQKSRHVLAGGLSRRMEWQTPLPGTARPAR